MRVAGTQLAVDCYAIVDSQVTAQLDLDFAACEAHRIRLQINADRSALGLSCLVVEAAIVFRALDDFIHDEAVGAMDLLVSAEPVGGIIFVIWTAAEREMLKAGHYMPRIGTRLTTNSEQGNYFYRDRHAAVPIARRTNPSDGAGLSVGRSGYFGLDLLAVQFVHSRKYVIIFNILGEYPRRFVRGNVPLNFIRRALKHVELTRPCPRSRNRS